MNKQQHIAMLKRQIKIGEDLMKVANQNYETAARSVSEAKAAMAELGASARQPRKGKKILSAETEIQLAARLTKINPLTSKDKK